MSKAQVIVTATPDGQCVVETTGVRGPVCEKLSEAIEQAIGAQTSNTRKPEYNQQAVAAQPQAAQQGAGVMASDLPEEVQRFLGEYKAICDKYKMLILSDGEEVEVVQCDNPSEHPFVNAPYWGIEETTARKWNQTL